MQKQPDPRARIIALRALARIGDETAVFNGLCDEDAGVNAHGVFWSLQSAPRAPVHDNLAITQLLAESGERGTTARRELLDAICRDGDSRWAEVLLLLAFSGAEDAFEALARAICHIPDARFIPFLIHRLGARGGRLTVRAALVAIGEPAMAALEAALVDPASPPRVRLHVPGSIAAFHNARAADALAKSLASVHAGAVRYRILRALARIATREEVIVDAALVFAELRTHLDEHTRLLALSVPLDADASERESAVLLRGLLHDKIAQALDRAFLALQVLHPREDMRETARALAGHDPRSRAHASEFLDNLTRMAMYAKPEAVGVRAQLLVVAEDLEAKERIERGELAALIPTSVEASLVLLMREPDALLAACAGYDALALRTPGLISAVDQIATEKPLFAPLGISVASRHVA